MLGCIVEYCQSKGSGRIKKGYCETHYSQLRRYGEIRPLTNRGKPHSVNREIEDWDWVLNNHKSHGYPMMSRRVNGVRQYREQHRVVMEQHLGRELETHENVHHINGNKEDNRLKNLELWSVKQPQGQRIIDKYNYAKDIVKQYEEDIMSGKISGGDTPE